MRAWTDDDLTRIGGSADLQLASRRPDGTLRPYVTIWVVRVGEDLYVRSAYGSNNPWFRRATANGAGRIRTGGVERDVTFADAPRTATATSTRPTTPSTTGTDRRSSEPSPAPRPPRSRSGSCRADRSTPQEGSTPQQGSTVMELRPLGRTGVSVSNLCLGTMMFGDWGTKDHD